MGILNSNQIPIGNYFKAAQEESNSREQSSVNQIDRAEKDDLLKKCNEASEETSKAIMSLGRAFFEATKDNPMPEYSEQIATILACMDKEKLLMQYKLSLSGKMLCESCGQTIPADSLFCNKCGAKITPPDFSSLEPKQDQQEVPAEQKVCPKCGATIVSDAAFCEKCGASLQQQGSSTPEAAPVQETSAPAAIVCPSCGSPLVEGAMFCEKCGHKI